MGQTVGKKGDGEWGASVIESTIQKEKEKKNISK